MPLGFLNRDDDRLALASGRLDQAGRHPGLAQDMFVIELQSVQVELDRTPGVRGHQIAEVVGELGCGQIVNLLGEVIADSADSPGIGLNGLRLQSLELQVFLPVRLVLN